MNYEVRDAKPSDFRFLSDAFSKVNDLHCRIQPEMYRLVDTIVPKWQFVAVTLGTRFLKPVKEKFCIKVAEYEGEPVGAILVESVSRSSLSWSAFSKVAHVENVTSTLYHRSRGAVDALMDSAEDWAKETGHCAISGKISSENNKSLSVAKDSGFSVQSVNVFKRFE